MVLDLRKSAAVVFFAIVAALVGFLSDNSFSVNEQINTVSIAAGAVLVSIVPNLTGGWANYTKAICMVVVCVADGVLQFIVGGVSTAEWLQVLLSVGALFGVVSFASNQPQARVIEGSVVPPPR